MPLPDHVSKVIVDWALGRHADTALALVAWRCARPWPRRRRVAVADLIVHYGRDPVYTGYGWTGQILVRDHVRLSYALRGCRDNLEMEAFHSRFKTENRSLFLDALTRADRQHFVAQRLSHYSGRRQHSALGNRSRLSYLSGLLPDG